MVESPPEVIVGGHICLDLIPSFPASDETLSNIMVPGKLVNVGHPIIATGGAVANTGGALHRLGFRTSLMGKTGADPFGRMVRELLQDQDPLLTTGMVVDPDVSTSYSVVLSIPGADRIFLHCPGANDTFTDTDVNPDTTSNAKLFHFGYPPLMKSIFADGGRRAANIFSAVRQRGVTTSLDMAKPDANSEAGQVDWVAWMKKVLPAVDVFLPSADELLFMLDKTQYEDFAEKAGGEEHLLNVLDTDILTEMADYLISLGPAIVAIKLGEHGFYLQTTRSQERLKNGGRAMPAATEKWSARQLLSPCLISDFAGATGAGDATIAGFLGALLQDKSPCESVKFAVGTGATSTEQQDAVSGIPHWNDVAQRLADGWRQHSKTILCKGKWEQHTSGLFTGPDDSYMR